MAIRFRKKRRHDLGKNLQDFQKLQRSVLLLKEEIQHDLKRLLKPEIATEIKKDIHENIKERYIAPLDKTLAQLSEKLGENREKSFQLTDAVSTVGDKLVSLEDAIDPEAVLLEQRQLKTELLRLQQEVEVTAAKLQDFVKGYDVPSEVEVKGGKNVKVDKKDINGVKTFTVHAKASRITIGKGSSGTVGGGASSADQISYTHSDYPAITNVKQALDQLLYTAPTVVMINDVNTIEVGQTVNDVTLDWTITGTITSQSIDQGIGSLGIAVRTYPMTGLGMTSTTTWTITVQDGTSTITDTSSVSFQHKRYYGTDANATLNDAQILALSQEFATSRVKSWSQDGNGEYIYYCYPASWGAATFIVNGLLNTAWTLSTQDFVNTSGHTESYRVYRTNTVQNGSGISISVS